MTTLVFGVAGAVVGNMVAPGIGGQIGFLLGTFVGNLIDPPKVEGPRRTDLKLQVAEYGRPIPYVWGTGRLAGVVVDQTDLQEHKETSGGKGGPEQTTYTYSASFLVKLAHRLPTRTSAILGINRIWADTRLIWDAANGDQPPCVAYLGTTTQLPDPTFEAIHGIGNQPAYRNDAYVTFTDWTLTDFGDRIPALEFEIFTKVGTFPWRIAVFNPDTSGYAWGNVWRQPAATFAGGVINLGFGFHASAGPDRRFEFLNIQGEEVSPAYTTPMAGEANFGNHSAKNQLVFSHGEIIDPVTGLPEVGVLGVSDNVGLVGEPSNIIIALVPSTFSQLMYVRAFGAAPFLLYTDMGGFQFDGFNLGTTNYVEYVNGGWQNGGITYHRVYVYNSDNAGAHTLTELLVTIVPPDGINLNIFIEFSREWDFTAEYVIQPIFNGSPFVVYKNRNGQLVLAVDRGIGGSKQVYCFYLNDDLTHTAIAGTNYGSFPGGGGGGIVTLLARGPLVLVGDGTISLEPPTQAELLADIVSDISAMTNVGAVDVTELTPEVRWFTVANQMEARNAIEELRRGFLFDGVEVDDAAVFKLRGATDSIVTIDDDDLCVVEYGGEPPDPLTTKRRREIGMPRTVAVQYIDVEADYQVGVQTSHRITTLSDSDVSLDLAIGFTATEAKRKAEALLTAEWTERESFEWSTSREYAWLKPADCVTVRGRVIRIRQRTETPDGVLKWEGVLHRATIYDQQQESSGSSGWVGQPGGGSAADRANTDVVLLDIPILSQADNPFGFYAAMGPATFAAWPGATLYKSLDGGVTYNAVAAANTASIIGATLDYTVGSPAYSGALGSYSLGDVVDESSITVVLTDPTATLSSATPTAFANGANLCAISRGGGVGSPPMAQWELLNFRDAVLIAAQTYVLTGFLRGRKGTATNGHATGDTFVVLPVTNVNAPESELNKTLWYKAVTYGKTLGSATAFEFTNTGLGAAEYYGTENQHQPPFTGDTGSPSAPSNGLVPAPANGDCAAGKFLSACGTWEVPDYPTFIEGKCIQVACSDQATAITTGTAKITFRMPFPMTVSEVRASLKTATATSAMVVDINEGGTTILSTKLSIDAGEKTSVTAATAPVISDSALADDAEITIDVDSTGTGGVGLIVAIIGT